jgi:hypothetical protein
MASYGQLLDAYHPQNEQMFKDFNEYFNRPAMIKIKDVDKFSVYMSKTYCLLSSLCRYLVVFINKDQMPIGTQEILENLSWLSFQTRTLPANHDLPPHSYTPRNLHPLNVPIVRTSMTDEVSTYSCESLPLTITLLNVKSGSSAYQEKGTLISALETYQTIISVNEQ